MAEVLSRLHLLAEEGDLPEPVVLHAASTTPSDSSIRVPDRSLAGAPSSTRWHGTPLDEHTPKADVAPITTSWQRYRGSEPPNTASNTHSTQLDNAALAAAVEETKKKVEELRRSNLLGATVLKRVTEHLEKMNSRARVDLDVLAPGARAARALFDMARKSRSSAAKNAGISEGAVEAMTDEKPSPPKQTPVVRDALPNLIALAEEVTWIEWCTGRAIPKILQDEEEMRAAAYLLLEQESLLLREQLEEQVGVLREAQVAMEKTAHELETARLRRDELRATLERLEDQIEEQLNETFGATEAELVAALDLAQRAHDEARRRADTFELQLREAERDRNNASLKLQTAKELLDAAERSYREADDSVAKNKTALGRITQEIDALERQIAVTERDIAKARHASVVAEEEIAQHRVKVADLEGTRDGKAAEIRAASRAVEELRRAKEEKAASRGRVNAQVARAAEELKDLRSKRQTALQELIDFEERLVEARQKADAAEDRERYLQSLLPTHHPLRRAVKKQDGTE